VLFLEVFVRSGSKETTQPLVVIEISHVVKVAFCGSRLRGAFTSRITKKDKREQ
jgi:hypothetical protein